MWSLRVLGRPTLHAARAGGDERDGSGSGRVDLTARLSPRMLDLLVFLALHPHGIRRDAIVAALWPETGRRRPANNLSALITRLRAAVAAATGPSDAVSVGLVSADCQVGLEAPRSGGGGAESDVGCAEPGGVGGAVVGLDL